jgi:hypothetical protein
MTIVYNGPSMLDGSPIVAIVTTSSKNVKTGSMAQLWIMRSDVDPVTASRTGADEAVCGTCPHRGNPTERGRGQAAQRACYVVLAQAPLGIYKAFKRGSYLMARTVDAIAAVGAGRMVRVGAYGDGAALPAWITSALIRDAAGHTAYSHQSGRPGARFEPERYMASVESKQAAEEAWSRGWRTFRVVADATEIVAGREIECPAIRGVKCIDCGLCGGSQVKAKSIAIVKHGSGAKYLGVS